MRYRKQILSDKIEQFINEHERICVIVMMFISAILLSHSFWDAYPLHTTTDELGTIVGAATLAGYDWSGVIEKSGYYGFGYYALFAPLFMLHLSPIFIYRFILVFTRVLRACVISGIAYYMGSRYMKFSSKFLLMQVSLICTLPLYADLDGTIVNDIVLEMMFWVVILLVCKMAEHISNTKKCIGFGVLYVLAVTYVSFLHTRALVIVIASFLVVLGLLIYNKKKELLVPALTIPAVFGANKLIKLYQNTIWAATEDGLKNTSVNMASELDLFDGGTWEIWFRMIIGHITIQNLLTGGLFIGCIVVVVKYLYSVILRKKSDESSYLNIALAIAVLSIGATFAAFMVSDWFSNMYVAWDTSLMGQDYSYKGLCYVRYWNIFAMPFLFCGVYLLQKEEGLQCIRAIILWTALFLGGFIGLIVPLTKYNSAASVFLYKYLTKAGEAVNLQFYYKCILICITVITISVIIYYWREKLVWAFLPIVLLMVVGYNNENRYYNEGITEEISAMALSSYEQKCFLEEADVSIGQIYAVDNRNVDRNWYVFSVLQYYFYEYRIEDEYPTELDSNDIIITHRPSSEIELDFPQLNCYVLDNNEVWYTELDLIGVEPKY